MDIEINKVYSFLDIPMSFGTLSKTECIQVFGDGRVCSHFLERQLTTWFPGLIRVDQKGFDHIELNDYYTFQDLDKTDRNNFKGVRYDQKSFTSGGVRFNPSGQIGMGRKFDAEAAKESANGLIYIITDISRLPDIHVVFKFGGDLIDDYSKCHIPFKDRGYLYG